VNEYSLVSTTEFCRFENRGNVNGLKISIKKLIILVLSINYQVLPI